MVFIYSSYVHKQGGLLVEEKEEPNVVGRVFKWEGRQEMMVFAIPGVTS